MQPFRFFSYVPQPTQREIDEYVGRLDTLLSRGLSINEASDEMGVTRGTGCVLYRMLRERPC